MSAATLIARDELRLLRRNRVAVIATRDTHRTKSCPTRVRSSAIRDSMASATFDTLVCSSWIRSW